MKPALASRALVLADERHSLVAYRQKMHRRFFRMSLGQTPGIRTTGDFTPEDGEVSWVQPRDVWQGLFFLYPGEFTLDGRTFEVDHYDLVVVPPGSRCRVRRACEPPFSYIYFTFAPVEMEKDQVMIQPLTRFGEEEGRFWEKNLRRALNRLYLSGIWAKTVQYAMLWAASHACERLERNPFVDAAERIIEERLDKPLRISEIAEELGISQSQLSRHFFEEHGTTPMQFILDRRADRASRMLTKTRTPIKQVAAQCGYPNAHAFNRFVRERLGASPRSIRNTRQKLDFLVAPEPTKHLS